MESGWLNGNGNEIGHGRRNGNGNGKIKKRDEMTDKNGKVNEKSKWKNGK